ncbi:uncharacterized [Tachysurus ichikawai]
MRSGPENTTRLACASAMVLMSFLRSSSLRRLSSASGPVSSPASAPSPPSILASFPMIEPSSPSCSYLPLQRYGFTGREKAVRSLTAALHGMLHLLHIHMSATRCPKALVNNAHLCFTENSVSARGSASPRLSSTALRMRRP